VSDGPADGRDRSSPPVSGVRRVGRNAGRLLAGRIVAQGLLVLSTALLAQRLGLAGFGGYAFVVAAVFLANVVTTFGTDMVLIREIAAGGRIGLWSAALAVQLMLSGGAVIAIWLVAPMIPGQGSEVAWALRVYVLSLVPAAVYSVCSAALRGAGRLGRHASLGVAAAGLQLAAIAVLVPPGSSIVLVSTVLLGVQAAIAALAWAACASWAAAFRQVPGASRSDVVGMVRATGSIGIVGLLGVAYQRAGVLVLAVAVGPAATAWFAGGSRIVEASRTGHLALFGALYPAMAEAHGSTPEDGALAGRLAWAWRLSLLGALAIAATLLVVGPVLVRMLYGEAFAPASAGLAILALALVPSTIAGYLSLELLAAHRERSALWALFASLAVLVALLLALVPAIGWTGAAWAILGADAVQAALLLLVTSRRAAPVAGLVPRVPSPHTAGGL